MAGILWGGRVKLALPGNRDHPRQSFHVVNVMHCNRDHGPGVGTGRSEPHYGHKCKYWISSSVRFTDQRCDSYSWGRLLGGGRGFLLGRPGTSQQGLLYGAGEEGAPQVSDPPSCPHSI